MFVAFALFLGISVASGPADFVTRPMRSPSQPGREITEPAPIAVLSQSPSLPAVTISEISTEIELLRHPAIESGDSVVIPIEALVRPAPPRMVTMEVTAYCACKKCCGSHARGMTASGKPVSYDGGHFVAADTRLFPYGTKVIVPGYNDEKPVEVIDRGGAIKGNHIDIFMPTHERAVAWGKRRLTVSVVEAIK